MEANTKILVIEDEPDLRSGITELLNFEGFQVVSAENGSDGLIKAISESPNLILCDILMPDMNGFEVLERWKKVTDKADVVPFIIITALSNRIDYRKGMEKGADDFLTKPFTREELLGAINSRLEKQASRKAYIEKSIKKIEDYLKNKLELLQGETELNEKLINQVISKNQELQNLLEQKENDLIKETMNSIEVANSISEIKTVIKTELKKCTSEEERNLLLKLNAKAKSKSLLSDNWTIFQMKFNQTYPHFVSRITANFSNLTQYDLVFISAIVTGLNTNQIADLLNISADSVRKSRYRLKKKLGLNKDDDLIKFVHSFNHKLKVEV